MPSCCQAFASTASNHFDGKLVARKLKHYREHGPGPTTRLLADGIAKAEPLGKSVLDVGAGFGGLTFALLDRGASRCSVVEASASYIEAAREEAKRGGRADAIQFVHADFVEAASTIPSASVVTLDRVVCCYPSSEPLLDAAVAHAERGLALSYPRDIWYVR